MKVPVKINSDKYDNRQQNFIIFKVTVTVKVGQTVVKAIAQLFNSQITYACSAQPADIFARALLSALLQNSLTYLKMYGVLIILELF